MNRPIPFSSLLPVVVTLPCFIFTVTLSPVINAGPDQSLSTIKLSVPSCTISIFAFVPLCIIHTLQPLSLLAFIAAVLFVVCADDIDTEGLYVLANITRIAFIQFLLLLV